MFAEVAQRIKKKNQILFGRDDSCLQELRQLIAEETHLNLVLWALDCLQVPLAELQQRQPGEQAPCMACECAWAWAQGTVKMPLARRAILDCHALAKVFSAPQDIALCHAIGQGCATVHVETHALGLVLYELTALVIACDYVGYEQTILHKIEYYERRLCYWQENGAAYAASRSWAAFLIRQGKQNKEKLLLQRQTAGRL